MSATAPIQSKDTYSEDQISAYLTYISFPTAKHPRVAISEARTATGLEYLKLLQAYQLAAVPFENLSLHYSPERTVSIDKDDLFEKIIGSKKTESGSGRGGYCMENNLFFGTVLKTLGYEVVPIGARVYAAAGRDLKGSYTGLSHQVNIIFFDDAPYIVDVGFGGNCATRPLPLVHDHPAKWGATSSGNRLIYQEPVNRALQGLWILEHRIINSHDWTPLYCFSMVELWPQDLQIMNFAIYTGGTSWFTYRILCLKMILDEETEEIIGVVIMDGGNVKKRVHGKVEILRECTTESQRLEALEKWFGIVLSEKQQTAIKGLVTALKSD